jgi:hypothetical protein
MAEGGIGQRTTDIDQLLLKIDGKLVGILFRDTTVAEIKLDKDEFKLPAGVESNVHLEITGGEPVNVELVSSHELITWDEATHSLVISSTLPIGSYTVVIKVTNISNVEGTEYTITIILGNAASISGPTSQTLTIGYAATSSSAFTVTGDSPVTVEKTSGDAKLTWDDTAKKINIAAGLGAGTYPAIIVAKNVFGQKDHNYTLNVNLPIASSESAQATYVNTYRNWKNTGSLKMMNYIPFKSGYMPADLITGKTYPQYSSAVTANGIGDGTGIFEFDIGSVGINDYTIILHMYLRPPSGSGYKPVFTFNAGARTNTTFSVGASSGTAYWYYGNQGNVFLSAAYNNWRMIVFRGATSRGWDADGTLPVLLFNVQGSSQTHGNSNTKGSGYDGNLAKFYFGGSSSASYIKSISVFNTNIPYSQMNQGYMTGLTTLVPKIPAW